MSDRRYREEEVRKIFKLATSERIASSPAAPASDGLTLAEIQSIGAEVGVDSDLIARAAAALDSGANEYVRRSFGAPVEVGMAVPLPRAMNEREWETVVAQLRNTFSARGQISTHGDLREWRNGNLVAAQEPFGNGYRLRLSTKRGDATGVTALGVAGLAASIATWVAHLVISDPTSVAAPLVMSGIGLSALAANWLRLPGWARTRAQQMKQIANSVRTMMSESR